MAFTEIEAARIQSVVIFEIRRSGHEPGTIIEGAVAKATYVRGTGRWKIYWQPADRKWHAYQLQPEALIFEEFLALVDEDKEHCFWG